MAEDKDALLQRYRRTREQLLAVIDGLTDAQLTQQTLDGWSVKDHLAHLAQWDDVRAAEVARISAGHQSAWRMTDEQDTVYNDMAYALRQDLSLDQVRWELAQSHARLLTAIAASTPRGLDPALYGVAGLAGGHEQEHTGWIKRWRTENSF